MVHLITEKRKDAELFRCDVFFNATIAFTYLIYKLKFENGASKFAFNSLTKNDNFR